MEKIVRYLDGLSSNTSLCFKKINSENENIIRILLYVWKYATLINFPSGYLSSFIANFLFFHKITNSFNVFFTSSETKAERRIVL